MRTPHGTPWTPAENLWAGAFGDDYQARSPGNVEANRVLFARILSLIDHPLWSVLEMGAGVGSNLAAIKAIDPEIETTGLDINATARVMLSRSADEVIHGSILDFVPTRQWQLVFTKGVLIHIPPEHLPRAFTARGVPESLGDCDSLALILEQFERQYIKQVLSKVDGRRGEAAALLGISRKALWHKLRHESR